MAPLTFDHPVPELIEEEDAPTLSAIQTGIAQLDAGLGIPLDAQGTRESVFKVIVKHFTLKTNPLKRTDLDDFVACYNPANRHHRKESERFRRFAYEDLQKRHKLSLDITWLRR